MEIICTRPSCVKPLNSFPDLDTEAKIRTVQQRYCSACGMPLLLADRYLPSKLLGQGGFGAAFLACDRYKPKLPLCVVKQFKPSNDLDADERAVAQKLFETEAVVLEELGQKHPQIPNLYAFFTPIVQNKQRTGEEQYFYLAQEFIDGQDLEQELAEKGRFSEAEVIEVLTEILKILELVHDNNTIHRDIKPSNIMRNKQGVLYLLDFGAVKQIAAGGGNPKKSTGIYSMGFAPPEQMSGGQIYPSTDIYALAVTCINLLTGKEVEELYDSFNNTWQWDSFAPNISDRLKQILNKMLLPTPSQRFHSAQEALTALVVQPNQVNSILPLKSSPNITPTKPILTPKQNQPLISTVSNFSNSPTPFNTVIPPVPVVPNTSAKPVRQARTKHPFTLTEVLGSAAFIGFEGALISIGLISWLAFSGESLGVIGAIMGGITFALYRRIIEKLDLVIFALITAGVVIFMPKLQGTFTIQTVLIIATISAAGAIAITAFFRLVYQLLSRFL
ncbi:serine/threonine protein kinase [Pleurocapsa sp. CCALA 161]|uniref:serine/threonine-protein kinase n=1 Tax=Pleurocapsa sp. CCALA 161 TaxID=2107688 RepID=UPI000D085066|nr:serine/threonine-protein kinase [Pleurocapsa sp. CCALA 161]PSB08103.1 serine/threonine protein kinase [Pleurocapsa sp. CCALA 161]